MDYKNVLVHVDQSRHAVARIRYAGMLARAHGGHLLGAAMTGLPRYVFSDGAWPILGSSAESCFQPLYERASQALRQFDALAAEMTVSNEKLLITDQDADALVLQARFADLVVITQNDPHEALPGQVALLPESVALASTAPVMLVPIDWTGSAAPASIVLAWNGSAAATRAVHAAIPLLQRADTVRLVSFCAPTDPFAQDSARELPRLTASLARHGVGVQECVRDQDIDAGNALLEFAHESKSDLIVMGCYGHSRFREMLAGGASRTVMRAAPVPVLMMH